MSSKLISLGTALALLSSQAVGHLVMIEPHPYNLDTAPLLQVAPLGASLPFPCQTTKLHEETVTTLEAGKTTLVKFQGAAVHGGGSCQFSVAYGDTPPSDASQWKVIYSIIGGCPAEAAGNIPSTGTDPQGRVIGPLCNNDSGMECLRQFNVPIPKDIKNGNAMFAWTWFNKIGNREMYMNCAPVKITGGSDDSSFVAGLPGMFIANVEGQCTTGNGVLGFPEPGKYGKANDQITADSQGTCKAPSDPSFDSSSGGDSSSALAGSGTEVASAPASTAQATSADSVVTSAAQSMATSAVETISTSTVEVVTSEQAVPTSAAPATSQASADMPAATDRPSWANGMTACPTSGDLVCFSESSFGICNMGWALPQDVPAGTACRDGAIGFA